MSGRALYLVNTKSWLYDAFVPMASHARSTAVVPHETSEGVAADASARRPRSAEPARVSVAPPNPWQGFAMYEAGIEPRSINHYPEVRPGTGGMLAALHAYDVPLHYSPYLEPPIWPPPPPAPRAPATARTPVHGVKDTRFKENSRWAVERHQNRAGGAAFTARTTRCTARTPTTR